MPPTGSLIVSVMALVVLVRRWAEGGLVEELASTPVTSPTSAVVLLISALSLMLVRVRRGRTATIPGRLTAVIPTLLGLAILRKHFLSSAVESTILGSEDWWARPPSPTTGLGLTFLGVALFAFTWKSRFAQRLAGLSAAGALMTGLAALIGHAYGSSSFYGSHYWGGTGVSTAISLILLSTGVLCADPSRGVAALAVSDSAGGRVLRRMLPAALLAVPLFGWLALSAENSEWVDSAFAAAMLSVLLMALFVSLLIPQAKSLHLASVEREKLLQNERRARAESERQKAELERLTESRARLMRGFSHDVKNSLGAAQVAAQLLESGRIPGELSERKRKSVQRIRRSIRTSVQLIDDLLEVARAESGQLEIQCVDTDVGHVSRELAEDFRAAASVAGLAVRVRAPEVLRTATDPNRLRQILANLLSNAVKYAPKGAVTISAELRHHGPRPGDWIAVSVADTGPGIPEDQQEHVFEEYSRLDPKAAHGAGIGLAISRLIARLIGGDLTLESELGRGSTFTLWLPAASPTSADARMQGRHLKLASGHL